uniref:Structural maintenance of chromosomes protein 5 n=1 Tax=Myripristis murdjan TaxID=586833 RepID=A0A668A922_9TELE
MKVAQIRIESGRFTVILAVHAGIKKSDLSILSFLKLLIISFLFSDRTYDYSVVHPGPNLNMIVGANGTGKSSIVCAICLGLAGKTAVLCRGDKVGLYVKRGCKKGFIEIEYKRGGNVVINREIHVENNQSIWMLNGRHSSQKAVEEEVKSLHIQVSNLCQFLPQEKVGEFAKMSKIELLEATEKSVGPPAMYEYHCELKNFRNKERELESVVKEKADFLQKARQRNERNKLDVNRYYEKKRHLDLIELLEKKKPWVEYETVRKRLEDVKKEREEAKQQLSSLRQTQAPMLKKIQAIENQLKPIDAQIKAKVRQLGQSYWVRVIDDIKQTLTLKQMEEEDHRKRISNTKRIIDDLKAELANVGDQPDVTPQIDAINAELRSIQVERGKIDGEKADLRREGDNLTLEKKLIDMNNMMKVKEEKLRSRHRDTHSALEWFRQNRELFTGNVHEPMMLVINVKNHGFAKYVENHIPFNDLRAFVFQRKDDMEKFMEEVRDKLNLKVNSIAAPEESCSRRAPSRHIESLRRFGFFSYLREMFDAPDEVMSYLCHQYRVHDVPVGNEQTKAMIKTVIEEPYIKILYTAEERYSVKRSLYSRNISTSNSAVHPSQYLTIAVDVDQKRQLEQEREVRRRQEIDQQMKALQQRTVQLDRRENDLRKEKKHLSELRGKKRQLEQKISTKQDRKRSSSYAQYIYKKYVTKSCFWLPQALSRLPDTLDELDAMLNEEQSRADCFTGLSESVVEEYNRREQEIKNLEKELDDKSNALNAYRQNISEAKERWLNPLKQLVDQINEKFSDFFRSMQCAGEVDLHYENEEEYDKYGIRIRVKFHSSTQMHELTAHHQSGGERSVSTMLYLMALQELNRCPFRVVDEINQGMDPINERRVFDIVVRTACKKTTSQYFFITPKLLQNLQYAEEMTILCVHNGAYMLPPNQWDEQAFIRQHLRRKARA